MRAQLLSLPFAAIVLFLSSRANAACVIHGARPTTALPTMVRGQEFSFIASHDCETLRFTIRGTTVSKIPQSGALGPGPHTYQVALTEREWNAVVADSGATLTWVVTGTTSAGVTTRMVTTNDLDLGKADAKLVGEAGGDYAGVGVSGAGDVNGDGNDDVLVGAWQNGEGAFRGGAAYVVLGPVTGTLDLSLADAKLLGEETDDHLGHGVSGAGDVDGDGHDDVLVGAPFNGEGGNWAGAAYLVLGPVTGTVDSSLADAKLVGEEADDLAGYFPTGPGDMDGDGHDDVLVDSDNDDGTGAAYLVLGPVTGTLDLAAADAKLVGEEAGDGAGHGAGAGDVDGDGHRDLLVSANFNDEGGTDAGAVYLVLGPVSGRVDLSLADAKLLGEQSNEYVGIASGPGDVDGDGHPDLFVGTSFNDEGGTSAGAAWLVLGPVTGTFDLSLADAKLVGEEAYDYSCDRISGAGDVDADGRADLLVGARSAGESGAAYLVLGPVTGTLDLSSADAKFVGEQRGDSAGISVSGAGDVDGDGRDDVLIGAYSYGDTGAAYLIYGGGL